MDVDVAAKIDYLGPRNVLMSEKQLWSCRQFGCDLCLRDFKHKF